MRTAYRGQLDLLVTHIAEMCDLVGMAMRRATTALLDGDLRLAEQVIADDVKVDQARAGNEEDARGLLALQAPVATDLRVVVAAMHAAEHVERMGDLAQHVAKTVRLRHPEPVLPPVLRSRFADMGRIAVNLATTAGQIVRNTDIALAATLMSSDDEMDDLHRSLFAVLGYGEWNHGVAAAVDAALLSRYYERFADHAVSVARRTTFIATGEIPHQR